MGALAHVCAIGVAIGGSVVAFTGCLFPSFDGIATQTDPSTISGAEADANSKNTNTDTRSNDDGGDASTTPINNDASSASGPSGEIKCGATSCKVGSAYCCVEMSSSSCRSSGTPETSCAAVMGCDENKDCGAGKICCGGVVGSACTSGPTCGSGSNILCNPTNADCPANTICQAVAFSGGTTLFVCD